MDGQNPNNKKVYNHGLRLVKGQAVETTSPKNETSPNNPSSKKKSPLAAQLSALADAIDADVKLLLNL